MLELVVFLCGAILMGLEMLGSRVLAPSFGNSIFVWGSLIGVFLSALAVGYYVGGLLADARPLRPMLGVPIAGAGLLVLAIPHLAGPVSGLAGLGPRLGPLLAATLLFFPPTVLLGMVTPFAIRLQGASVPQLGRAAGRLYAVSTVGSIAGTLGTAFFLVPAVGVTDLLRYLGTALLLLGGGLAAAGARWQVKAALAGIAALAVLLSPLRPVDVELAPDGRLLRVLYRKDSLYHHIRVVEGGGARYLRFDNSWQSGMSLADPAESVFPYPDYFHLAMVLRSNIRNVLFVGLGGGQAPKRFLRDYPWVQVDVVELDPEVVRVAREYFFLPDDPRLRVVVEDGRRYLEKTDRRYDLIVLDAYYADAIPFHLTTREFFRLVKDRLREGGLVTANVIGALEGRRAALFHAVYRTVAEVFPERYVFPVYWSVDPSPRSMRNIILFAGNGPTLSPADIEARVEEARQMGVRQDVLRLTKELYAATLPLIDVPVLTDDRAPVEDLLRLTR